MCSSSSSSGPGSSSACIFSCGPNGNCFGCGPTFGSGGVPHGHRLDLVEFNLPLENLLDLAFIWTLFHLLSSNHVQEFRRKDQVTFHCLWRVQFV